MLLLENGYQKFLKLKSAYFYETEAQYYFFQIDFFFTIGGKKHIRLNYVENTSRSTRVTSRNVGIHFRDFST